MSETLPRCLQERDFDPSILNDLLATDDVPATRLDREPADEVILAPWHVPVPDDYARALAALMREPVATLSPHIVSTDNAQFASVALAGGDAYGAHALAAAFRALCAAGFEPLAAIGGWPDAEAEALATELQIEPGAQETGRCPVLIGEAAESGHTASPDSVRDGDALFLIGTEAEHLGRSLYQRVIVGETRGAAATIDPQIEAWRGRYVRRAIATEYSRAAIDIVEGGLGVALARLCSASGIGADVSLLPESYPHAALFGEDASRYVVAVPDEWAGMFAGNAEASGAFFRRLGAAGGERLRIGGVVDLDVAELPAYSTSDRSSSRD